MGKYVTRINELEPEQKENNKVIAVMNNKGGCGKTSTAIALGMYLARTGHNVLFWDGDPQCNLTQRLGIPNEATKKTMSTLFKKPDEKIDIVQIMKYPHLQRVRGITGEMGIIGILPGDELSERSAKTLESDFQAYPKQTERSIGYSSTINYLNALFEEKKKYFEYIVMDTAPALQGNTLNVLALNLANEIIYPVDSIEAMTGLGNILEWMKKETWHRQDKPNGMFSMVKYQEDVTDMKGVENSTIKNAVFRSMKKVFKGFVCNNGVKELRSLRLGHESIPGFGGITPYTMLSAEIIEKIHKTDRKNLFEFIEENGAIQDLYDELALLTKLSVKNEPVRRDPQYSPRKLMQEVSSNDSN